MNLGAHSSTPDRSDRPWLRLLTLAISGVTIILAAIVAREMSMLERIERSLLYFPSSETVNPRSAFGPGAAEVWFGDHARLHGMFAPAGPGTDTATTTVVFFHGNGGNLSHRAPLLARMRSEVHVNVFIFDYQGYGQSSGVPSEAATVEDARAAIRYLRTRPDIDPARLVYHGESLGGAVAIQLATEQPPLGLVVQSSFTSVADMTRLHYPALAFLLPWTTYRYDSLSAVRSVKSPLMLIHGELDSLIPPSCSQQLLEAAPGPKRLLTIPGAGHNDVFSQGGPELWKALREFLASLDAAKT